MKYKYPIYIPYLKGNEKKFVNECLDSTWISSKGKFVELFETEFSKYLDINHSATVSNGTVALHLALLTIGIGPGDEVIVPTFTYIASVNSITYTGATPVFVDSVHDTWQMDPDDVRRKITPRSKAIMPVHLYGHPCDMDALTKIARENDLYVIEDCAEAFGTKYKGQFAGTFGDIACFSFFGNKTITTGEGGMISTNDKLLYKRAVHIKGQGLASQREYWHDVIGYNYRMTNICAAIGLAQLEIAENIIVRKRRLANWYFEHLAGLPIEFQKESQDTIHTYWMVTILIESADCRHELREHLKKAGIETRPTFFPIHTMPIYFSENGKFPVAEDLAGRGINLPSYPDLTEQDVIYITDRIKEYYEK
ncbi:MAG: DegT/DnrJ/EryC1/StrS family aminotransferase [Bacteroidota bacterium]|nr:DegT/DnrJ/EryC1/StrS family aminotransferase [bacterium]